MTKRQANTLTTGVVGILLMQILCTTVLLRCQERNRRQADAAQVSANRTSEGTRNERTLIDLAHVIANVNAKRQSWYWLSGKELLVVTTDRAASNLLGSESEEIHWQGHADLVNALTGNLKPLQGLTAVLNRKGVSPMDAPDGFEASPNRISLVWMNHKSMDHWPFPAAADLDGTHYREWNSDTRGSGFFLDDRRWVEQSDRNPLTTHVIDLRDASKDREAPSDVPYAKGIFAHLALAEPVFVEVDSSDPNGGLEITAYRTEDTVQRMLSQRSQYRKGPSPIQRSHLVLPPGAAIETAVVSPTQRSILYHVQITQANPPNDLLNPRSSDIPQTPACTESLWVSKANGQGFHELGHVAIPGGAGDFPELTDVKWLPGGTQISFVYRDSLYVIPTETLEHNARQ